MKYKVALSVVSVYVLEAFHGHREEGVHYHSGHVYWVLRFGKGAAYVRYSLDVVI